MRSMFQRIPNRTRRVRAFSFLALCALILGACGGDTDRPAGTPAATVTTTVVQPAPWRDAIEALGTAQANESVLVTAKVTETVERVNFEDGDYVEAGAMLVDLSGRVELAELEEARAAYQEAEQQLVRQQELAGKKLIAASALDTQRAARDAARARMDAVRARLGDRVITAPFSGVLGFRQVSPGTLVTPGTTIASLDDVSKIKLDFQVPETFLAALAAGQDVTATSAAYEGRQFVGKVTSIGSRIDPVTRAVAVRAEIPNPERLLRPGMLLSVRLFKPERQALTVPEIAVLQVASESFVFRVKPDETVEQVKVVTGARRRGDVEIVEGLNAGDRIVVDGTVKLRPGARVVEVPAPDQAATVAQP